MKLSLLSLLLSAVISINGFAQFKTIAESKKFTEPAYAAKIVQMKNGNTVLLYMSPNGFDIRIYDAAHQEKVTTSVPSSISLSSTEIENVFEINADIALFVSGLDNGNIPTITRFVIDGNTGKLKDQKILATSDKRGRFNNMSASFYVKKELEGDHYAIAIYHVLQDDREKRIEILQYDGQHTEINKSFLVSADNDDYKFFVLMDMVVPDADHVNVFLYNGKEKYFFNAKKGRLVMATVNKNNSNTTYTVINLPEEIKFEFCRAVYQPTTKKLYALVAEPRHKDDPISQYYIKIEPQTNKADIIPFKRVSEDLNKQYRDKYSLDVDYFGSYRELHVYDDESFTVVYEISFSYTATSSGMGFGSSGSISTYYTGKILVADYTKQAALSAAYITPKLYVADTYSPYKQFKYINTGKSRYICFNDTKRNNEVKKDKFVEIRAVAELDAFYHRLTGNDVFPKRNYILGEKDKGHELLGFGTSNYNQQTNTLVTLHLSKETMSDRDVSLIWLQPE